MSLIVAYRIFSHDGDLIPSAHRDSRPCLHCFQIPELSEMSSVVTISAVKLLNKSLSLDLDQATGVMGRRISLVDATGITIAEGILGWN